MSSTIERFLWIYKAVAHLAFTSLFSPPPPPPGLLHVPSAKGTLPEGHEADVILISPLDDVNEAAPSVAPTSHTKLFLCRCDHGDQDEMVIFMASLCMVH